MSKSGKTGRRVFAVQEWADYVRWKETNKPYRSGIKFENPEEEILSTKAIEQVTDIYVISYGDRGEKRIIEDGVYFVDWNRAKAWADRHADGDNWRIESLSRIDHDYRV
ncbi:hypothetical protein OB955_04815 [Halobacteria archaeon AArc-m2/3/4]|uniref:Uncharacterized protein n=1 Tax=Natronoglomus mannanivorans TaxID=2979990 RepID=A0ABT2QAW9_9EURY|nr:hypothetical protein [Halobacteria archaeon AArc-m2/3/4]